MKPLADMTPQERGQCRGMWCDYTRDGVEKELVIVAAGTNDEGRIPCVNPGAPFPSAWVPEPWTLTPRPDLPRAWAPDSRPPQGEWEYAEYLGDHGGMTDVYYFDGDPTHRQWVGEWGGNNDSTQSSPPANTPTTE